MRDLLSRIKAAWHITRNPPEPITVDSIYPLVLRRGTITYSTYNDDAPTTLPNSSAVINEDQSITLIQAGDIAGWIPPGECLTIISE